METVKKKSIKTVFGSVRISQRTVVFYFVFKTDPALVSGSEQANSL